MHLEVNFSLSLQEIYGDTDISKKSLFFNSFLSFNKFRGFFWFCHRRNVSDLVIQIKVKNTPEPTDVVLDFILLLLI